MSTRIKLPKSKLSIAMATAAAGLASQANGAVIACEDITVTTGTDNTTTAPAGSLREAIESINSTGDCGDFHTITFDGGVTTVELDGRLDVYYDTQVQGPGVDKLTITTSSTGSGVRFNAHGGDLKLSDLSFDNIVGIASGNGGNLELDSVAIQNSSSRAIYAINQYGYDNNITISNSLITGNAYGGISANDTDLYISDSVISNNTGAHSGAGIRFSGSEQYLAFSLKRSSVDGNTASSSGAGIYFRPSGDYASFDIDRSGITNNTLTNQYAYGAGLYLKTDYTDGVISNTTISGNSHEHASASGFGGGIFASKINNGSLDINASTIVNNSAPSGSGFSRGNYPYGDINLDGTVLADNDGDNGDGELNNVSNSFIGDTTGITINGTQSNSTVDGDDSQIGLAALAANGGLALSHMPNASSPLVNAGASSSVYDKDQLGNARVVSGKMDIGAVERKASPNAAKPWNGNPSSGSSSFSFLALLGSLVFFRRKLK